MLMSDDPSTKRSTNLEAEAKALPNVSSTVPYHGDSQVKSMYHTSFADCTITFCWEELPGSKVLQ